MINNIQSDFDPFSDHSAFPLVEIAGSPRERGKQYGRAVPERISRSAALYRDELQRRGVDRSEQLYLAANFIPAIAAYEPAYLEEMRGIAEGSGVAIEDIVTINTRTEMVYGSRRDAVPLAPDKADGCTGVVAMPEATACGRLLHAHNWDWRPQCVDTGIVLCIRRDDNPDVMTFVEAGGLGRLGFNAAGLALTGNFLQAESDFKVPGAPLGLVRRKMLEAGSMAEAMRVVWSRPLSCANNLMLSHAGGEAIDLECTAEEIFWLQPEDGLLVHANHFVSPAALGRIRDAGLPRYPDSLYRQRRVRAALAQRVGAIELEHLKDALADDFGKPDGVLCHPTPAGFGSYCATVATTLMDPGERRMWIARAPWRNREFVEYRL
jgi:isopenicillin-N N-acyltransferase-like protein